MENVKIEEENQITGGKRNVKWTLIRKIK